MALAERCCREDWSARRLELERGRLQSNKLNAGRRPRLAESRNELLARIAHSCDQWLRTYRAEMHNEKLDEPLKGLRKLTDHLIEAEAQLVAIKRLAEEHALRRSGRGS